MVWFACFRVDYYTTGPIISYAGNLCYYRTYGAKTVIGRYNKKRYRTMMLLSDSKRLSALVVIGRCLQKDYRTLGARKRYRTINVIGVINYRTMLPKELSDLFVSRIIGPS